MERECGSIIIILCTRRGMRLDGVIRREGEAILPRADVLGEVSRPTHWHALRCPSEGWFVNGDVARLRPTSLMGN